MGKHARTLPQRYIRGDDLLMIVVSVGCSNFKFDRLFKILDSLCEQGVIDGKNIIAQTGVIDYKIKNYKNFPFTSNVEMGEFIDSADCLICHAGTGTVVGSLKKGKKIIIFPRLKEFDEHESDNQLELAEQFTGEGYVLCAKTEEELKNAIMNINAFEPKKFVSNKDNFVDLIRKLIKD